MNEQRNYSEAQREANRRYYQRNKEELRIKQRQKYEFIKCSRIKQQISNYQNKIIQLRTKLERQEKKAVLIRQLRIIENEEKKELK